MDSATWTLVVPLTSAFSVKQRESKPHRSGFNKVRGELEIKRNRSNSCTGKWGQQRVLGFGFCFVFETINSIAYLYAEGNIQ